MEALSWFKFCPAKWNMGKTKKLNMEEKAEYLDLCSSYWVGGCVMDANEMREHSDCIDLFLRRGLISDDGIEWLNTQYEEATRKSDAASKAARIRWEKKEHSESNADVMRTHSESNAPVMQRRVEESRGEEKEREDRKIERETRVNADESDQDFFDYSSEAETEKEKVPPKRKRFEPPNEMQVQAFFQTTASPNSWSAFYNYYLANGWKVGKNPMKDWHAAARGWVARQNEFTKPQTNGRQQPNTEQLARSLADGIASGKYDITKG